VVNSAVAYRKQSSLLGRAAAGHEVVTGCEEIHPDPAAAVSSGRSTHASEEGPNSEREYSNVGLMSGIAPANQLRLSFTGSEDGEAETATCRAAKPRRTTTRASGPCGLNLLNRRMRTRISGGVTGKAGDSLPMSIRATVSHAWWKRGPSGESDDSSLSFRAARRGVRGIPVFNAPSQTPARMPAPSSPRPPARRSAIPQATPTRSARTAPRWPAARAR
jgi:hypothetical protein